MPISGFWVTEERNLLDLEGKLIDQVLLYLNRFQLIITNTIFINLVLVIMRWYALMGLNRQVLVLILCCHVISVMIALYVIMTSQLEF